jgi:hypothetical protein
MKSMLCGTIRRCGGQPAPKLITQILSWLDSGVAGTLTTERRTS